MTAGVRAAPETSSDCSRCFGLCCVALPFARSADFPVDKPAGMPCGHLGGSSGRHEGGDHSCGIHASLLAEGYRGCTVFECFGAGQQVSQVTFRGRSWREAPDTAAAMFAVFPVMHAVHEMLRHVEEVLGWDLPAPLRTSAVAVRDELVGHTGSGPHLLMALDVGELRSRVGAVLGTASELVRAAADRPARPDRRLRRSADLVGADLRDIDARGADLRGALLIAADLRGADMRQADLLGADLRDADVRGADLTTALYLTQPQVNAARGDAGSGIPASLVRPQSWGERRSR